MSNTNQTVAETPTTSPPTEASAETADFSGTIKELLSTTNLMVIFGFLGVYIGISYFMKPGGNGQVVAGDSQPKGSSLLIDILFFAIIAYILYYAFISFQNSDSTVSSQVIGSFTDFVDNPSSILIVIFVLVGLYVVSYLSGLSMAQGNKPISISMIESIAWLLLIVLLFVDFFKYVFGVSFEDLFDKIKAFFQGEEKKVEEEETEVEATKCDSDKTEPDDPNAEVFNVSNNLYTYDDAQAICKSYDAKLATYDQVEQAYDNGAEWCNYGWSEGQMALFPTQKNTWNELQARDVGVCNESKKVGNNCGRPGINGGYIANPYVRFGVNCFGKKPKATEQELKQMNANETQAYPMTPAEKKLEKKVDFWKKNGNKYLELNSYNTKKWTEKNSTQTPSATTSSSST
tara:strand:- start:6111 stop:7319 length:1209 start_codon:yes stop_codon:yes gene_type:complete